MEYRLTRAAALTLVTSAEAHEGEMEYYSGYVDITDVEQSIGMSRVWASVRGCLTSIQLEMSQYGLSFLCYCEQHQEDTSCRHIAAVLYAVTDGDSRGLVVSDEATAATGRAGQIHIPRWIKTLDRLLPQPQHEVEAALQPLGLLVKVEKVTGYRQQSGYEIKVRPARPGTRSPWVQSGVSWSDLAYDQRFDAVQRQAVRELERLHERTNPYAYSSYRWSEEWVSISRLPARELLEILERIRDSGVVIVNAASQRLPLEFSEHPASGFINLRRTDEGLHIEAGLTPPEERNLALLPFGSPPVLAIAAEGSVEQAQRLELARFDPPISAELLSMVGAGEVLVPDDQIEEFETRFLARMRQVAQLGSDDDSYRIPQPARPVLQIHLDSDTHRLDVSYRWHYSDQGPRQREVEREIMDSVEDKLGGGHPLGRPVNGNFPSTALDRNGAIEFVVNLLPLMREHPDIRVHELTHVPDYRLHPGVAEVSVEAKDTANDWFDLGITVSMDGRAIPFVELFAALSAGEDYLVLEDDVVVRIDGEEFQQLRQLIAEAGELADTHAGGVRMHKLSIDWWQELQNLGIIEAQENDWLRSMSRLSSGDELESLELPASFAATLRDYQQQGASWLHFLRTHSLGGVLADDMGLGKTVQLLAALEAARLENPHQKFLVIAPTTVAGNWANEAARFVPEMRTVLMGETSKKRGLSVAAAIADANDAQLVITSYAVFRLDFESFDEVDFSVLILDEAQQLKNHTSKGYKQARQMAVPCKFVVTGTPVENNLLELWALVSLAAPGLLGGLKAFKDNYVKHITAGDRVRLQRLRKRLRPFVLRRTKDQVANDLPAKTEQVLRVELEPSHRKVYDRRFQRVRQEILGLVDDVDSNRFKILQSLTLLRQLALDPSLVDEGDAPSAKLQLLRELLSDAVAEGHKVLVFSQFTGFLSKARDTAEEMDIKHGYLDGSTSQSNRRKLIGQFTAGDFPVFFISLKAGGFGINLTSADYCILLDPWWNPAAEAQAVDRAHRIGQSKPVYVYRLVANDTIESKVLALQEKKTQLFNDVLGDRSNSPQTAALGADDFLALIQ